MNTGLSVISRAPTMSKKVSHSLERSLSNTLHGNSIALFTIIESLLLSVCLPRTWPIRLATRSIVVSKQPRGTGSYLKHGALVGVSRALTG
jgi:hypothetical protein